MNKLASLNNWSKVLLRLYRPSRQQSEKCCILVLDRAANQESGWIPADVYAHRKQVDVKQLYNQVPQSKIERKRKEG